MNQDEKLVVITTCHDLFEAELVAGRLEANSITASIRNCTDTAYLTSPYAATNTFEVIVLESDVTAALEVLKD